MNNTLLAKHLHDLVYVNVFLLIQQCLRTENCLCVIYWIRLVKLKILWQHHADCPTTLPIELKAAMYINYSVAIQNKCQESK